MGSGTRLLLLISTLLASPVAAQELKPLCPDRGAFQACTVDAGHVQVEVSIADWFDDADSTLLLADTVVRYGLDDSTEIQVGMSPFVRKSFGQGRGDLRLAVRKRLLDSKFSLAVQPTLIVPTGSSKLSGARVMPGLAVGTTYDISPRTQLYASPYTVVGERTLVGTFIGVNQVIKGPIGGTVEYMVQHQRGETQSAADFTLTYTASKSVEFDINANVGLTRQTPALELVLGITKEF